MPFQVIAGRFFVTNYAPDGDTIRFQPDDIAALAALDGVPARVNMRGHAAIRFEGIDTLETHYSGHHQPAALGDAATDFTLATLGITEVAWNDRRTAVISADDGVPGFIAARATDKFGRIVAFVFPAAAGLVPGPLFLEGGMLDKSANAALLTVGLAYPTFYSSLFADLRRHLADLTATARDTGAGLHADDVTQAGFDVTDLGSLTDDLVILPKLFRRTVVYVSEMGTIEGFKAALEMSREPVLDLTTQNFTHFDTFVEQEGTRLRLTRAPEDLVFDPMPERPGGEFAMMLEEASDILSV